MKSHFPSCLFVLSLLSVSVVLTGCSGLTSTAAADISTAGPGTISGVLHGGQYPVSGATVTLWAAGSAGYGSASTALATTTSGTDGSFSFGPVNGASPYSCPNSASTTVSQQIYITASGGQATASYTNSSIGMMVGLGDCITAQSANQNLIINEVTTVASVFALQQFISINSSGLVNIGAPTTNITGMRNAFATINNLVNTASGTANTTLNLTGTVAGYTTSPTVVATPEAAKINTIADILAACINSTSGTSSNCTTLLDDVNSVSSKPALDTMQAAYYMAVNPTSTVSGTSNISTLYGLITGVPPFPNDLSSPPNDWTIGVTYGSTASQTVAAAPTYLITDPKYIALDSLGNVWIVNSVGTTGNSVAELSPTGVPEAQVLTSAGTLVAPSGIAVDPNNNLFVPNYGASGVGNTVTEYTSLGVTKTFTLKSTGPEAIASDGAGNILVASAGVSAGTGDIEAIAANAASGAASVTQASNVSVGSNSALAIDENFNLWLSNASNTAVTQFLCSSTPCVATLTALPKSPDSIAVDHAGNIWVGNISGSLTELAATSTTSITESANSPFSGGGLTGPYTGLIDGLGNVWETDFSTGSGAVSELTYSGAPVSPSTGFTHTFNGATGLAIDGSGNVWIGNSTAAASSTVAGYVTEIVGQAAPLTTPLSAALPGIAGGPNTLGTRP
jgi:hypothetical protein